MRNLRVDIRSFLCRQITSSRLGGISISFSQEEVKRNKSEISPQTADMKKFSKIIAIMFLSTCCLAGAVGCGNSASVPDNEQQQRRSEDDPMNELPPNDEMPELPPLPAPERPENPMLPVPPDCPKPNRAPRFPHKKKRGESDRKPHDHTEEEHDGTQNDGGEQDEETDPLQSLPHKQKRLPITPSPKIPEHN